MGFLRPGSEKTGKGETSLLSEMGLCFSDIFLSLWQHWSPETPTQGQHHSKDFPLQEWPKADPS